MSRLNKGRVYLVGAGPGDPKLISVRGMEAIQKADVIVYDRLANPRLLKHRGFALQLLVDIRLAQEGQSGKAGSHR